jgi:hypothetical protein
VSKAVVRRWIVVRVPHIRFGKKSKKSGRSRASNLFKGIHVRQVPSGILGIL